MLGVGMGLSKIFEIYELFISDTQLVSGLFIAEWFVVAGLFIGLLSYMTNRHSKQYPAEVGFSYASALLFVMTMSMFVGVIVGVMEHIYITAIGYDTYVAGFISFIDEYFAVVTNLGVELPADIAASFTDMQEALNKTTAPSVFETIFATLSNYIYIGLFLGLIIAAFTRRKPMKQINQQ